MAADFMPIFLVPVLGNLVKLALPANYPRASFGCCAKFGCVMIALESDPLRKTSDIHGVDYVWYLPAAETNYIQALDTT